MARILGKELLSGEKVYLNRVTRADFPRFVEMFQDVDFLRYISRRPAMPETLEEFEEWYASMGSADSPTFAVRALDDGQLIGICAFKDLRWASRHTFFWIGIGDPSRRGRGYGADAVRVLLKYAFMELNLNCVALEVFSYNEAAIATYRKVGFKHDGTMRALIYRDGVYYDQVVMSMLRGEWDARYGPTTPDAS